MSAARVLPWALHVTLEYLVGSFLVLAPFLLGFTDSAALPVLLGAGVVILAVAVLSRGRVGIVGFLPVKLQAAVEYLLAFFLMVAPFVFGFTEDADALLISVMVGLGLLVISLLTRYPMPAPPAEPTAPQEEPAATDSPAALDEESRAALEPPGTNGDIDARGTGGGTGTAGEIGGGRTDDLEVPEWVERNRDGERDTSADRSRSRERPREEGP